MSIKLKIATKGATLDSDVHEKFDVCRIPYQNLPMAHSLREAWQAKNKDKDWDDKAKGEVAMRPATKSLGSGDRSDSLSYDKLVRSTAVRYNKSTYKSLETDKLEMALKACDVEFDEVTETHRVSLFILTDKTRLFQNLVFCLGMDDLVFRSAVSAIDEAVVMFMADVVEEVPHALPSAGGGKSKAEIEAEIKAKQQEAIDAIQDEVKVYVSRVPTEHGVNGVPFPDGASIAMLQGAYEYEKDKLEHNVESDGVPAMLERLEEWANPFRQFWGV